MFIEEDGHPDIITFGWDPYICTEFKIDREIRIQNGIGMSRIDSTSGSVIYTATVIGSPDMPDYGTPGFYLHTHNGERKRVEFTIEAEFNCTTEESANGRVVSKVIFA